MVKTGIASISVFSVLAATCGSAPALARADTILSPTTPWNLDVTDSGCALRRSFGPKDRSVFLEMRRYHPGDGFQLAVDGKDFASLVTRSKVTIEYGDVGADADSPFQQGTSKREGQGSVPAIFLSSAIVPPVQSAEQGLPRQDTVTPEMEKAVQQIAVVWGGNRVVLATGSLGKPFAAMRSCTDALLKSWDLDPAVQNALSRPAAPANPRAMIRAIQAVYPMTMAAQGKQGRVNFRALVDAQGAVTSCGMMKSYNEAAFDLLACQVIQRTRFDPALDKDGKPVASYYAETVIYSMS